MVLRSACLRRLRSIGLASVLGVLILVICQAYVLQSQSRTLPWVKPASMLPADKTPEPLQLVSSYGGNNESYFNCDKFPISAFAQDGIQVVLKTGGADSQERLYSHAKGITACIPNILVVADMDHQFGPFHAHDVIADMLPVLPKEDRRTYQRQRDEYFYQNKKLHFSNAGWKLDRWKFLAMVDYAYHQNPGAKWYAFAETDTLMVWENVIQLLARYNHTDPLYIGSPTRGRRIGPFWAERDSFFTYGGTGFILSIAAMEKLLLDPSGQPSSERLVSQYKIFVRNDCCGDSVLGWVAALKKVKIAGLWPMFNPQTLHSTPLGRNYWCQPVISFHKSNPADTLEFWKWQQLRRERDGYDSQRPILFSDLVDFMHFAEYPSRENWNNADMDGFTPETEAHKSFGTCRTACRKHRDCLQFTPITRTNVVWPE